MRKAHIPTKIKVAVWFRDAHPGDNRIAQCKTCSCIVRFPMSIAKKLNQTQQLLPFNCNGVGEFGHIIAESRGGQITTDNLIIQCKPCNCKNHNKTLRCKAYIEDQYMLDINNSDSMEVDVLRCLKCKNKPIINRSYCHVHAIN